jgi:methionyl aminopeptidase
VDKSLKGHVNRDGIRLYGAEDFAGMHKAGALAAEILDHIASLVVPGVMTEDLDRAIEQRIKDAGATSATVGYKG